MSFRRTNTGLSNLYLFYNVDAIVFVEGGQSISREEADNGNFTANSSDIRFWQSLFNIYCVPNKFQFRSVGSKETVKNIAEDIALGRLTHVITAMDRDFDNINMKLINSTNVIYTMGYSWENDCWGLMPIIEAFSALTGTCKSNLRNEITYLEQSFELFDRILRNSVRLDAILSQHNNSFFNRENPHRYISLVAGGEPKINIAQIKASIIDVRARNARPIFSRVKFVINTPVDCYGHLFADLSYRLLTYLLGKVPSMPKLPKEFATSMIVEKFESLLCDGLLPELRRHYDHEFAKISM